MVKISVIMPVYNAAKYLEESLQSLQKQIFQDYELICINDASKDETFAILEKFQKQDDRIIIINHEMNCGAAISRNDGLKIAKGEYVIFLDADDFFYSDLLEVSYRQAIQYNADVVIFGSEQEMCSTLEVVKKGYSFQTIDCVEKKVLFFNKVRHVSWDKLVRRTFLLENNILFQNIPANNDVFYSHAVMLLAERIVVCDKVLLKYFYGRTGSLTETRITRNNYTVEAFYALYLFCTYRKIEKYLKLVCLNVIVDNIQSYLSNELYSLKIRQNSLKNLLKYQDMIGELYECSLNNELYPHNQKFVEKLVKKENVCNINYFQYYLEGVEDIITDKKNSNKKIALWGCGQNGRKLLDIIGQSNISIDFVVDENKEIQGKIYSKYKICAYDEIKDKVDIILITNLEYEKEIEKRTDGKEVIYVWK